MIAISFKFAHNVEFIALIDNNNDDSLFGGSFEASISWGTTQQQPGKSKFARTATSEESISEQLAKITPQILAAISIAAKNMSSASSSSLASNGQ